MKLPDWMKDSFEKATCPYCKKTLSPKGVKSHGIREERSKSKNKIRYNHFYDYKCPKCKNSSVFSFPTSIKDFINDMIELAEDAPPSNDDDGDMEDLVVPKRKSGISDDEVADAKRVLDNAKDLKDFFGKIGINITAKPEKTDDESK